MNKHYAITDLHGMYSLWKQISDYCDWNDTIYFLGDAADRGKNGFEVIRDLLLDPRVYYLRGDHEEFFYTIGQEILDGTVKKSDISMWEQNGGDSTYEDLKSIDDEWKRYYIDQLCSLPIGVNYINTKGQHIFLSHAGVSPMKAIKSGNFLESQLMWDRNHCYDNWPEGYGNLYIIHGHTPASYVRQQLFYQGKISNYNSNNEILSYANGHKFDLDLASWETEKVALFDLDELKVERYFYDGTDQ